MTLGGRIGQSGAIAGILAFAYCSSAFADPPVQKATPAPAAPSAAPAAPSVAPAVPPDIVVMKDGSMVRGVILEKKVRDFVQLQTASGEVRKITMADVTYAGTAASMPTTASTDAPPSPTAAPDADRTRPFVTIHAEQARLRLTANQPQVTFSVKTGEAQARLYGYRSALSAASFTSICTAPCEATLPAGTHEFALSVPGHGPALTDAAVTIPAGGHELRGVYRSAAGTRTAGVVIAIVGILGGAALMAHAITSSEPGGSNEMNMGEFAGGGVLMALGGLTGSLMMFARDTASVTVTPASPAAVAPKGVVLSGRF